MDKMMERSEQMNRWKMETRLRTERYSEKDPRGYDRVKADVSGVHKIGPLFNGIGGMGKRLGRMKRVG